MYDKTYTALVPALNLQPLKNACYLVYRYSKTLTLLKHKED